MDIFCLISVPVDVYERLCVQVRTERVMRLTGQLVQAPVSERYCQYINHISISYFRLDGTRKFAPQRKNPKIFQNCSIQNAVMCVPYTMRHTRQFVAENSHFFQVILERSGVIYVPIETRPNFVTISRRYHKIVDVTKYKLMSVKSNKSNKTLVQWFSTYETRPNFATYTSVDVKKCASVLLGLIDLTDISFSQT